MIISTLEELRLHIPANAIDNIKSMTGFIESSEYDMLRDKLGKPLYQLLLSYYSELGQTGISSFISDVQSNEELSPYARLLFLSQRIVAFDAIGNAVGAHIVSINGAGINTMTADDYPQADKEKIAEFKNTCRTECHKAVNILLETIEDWVKDQATTTSSTSVQSGSATTPSASVQSGSAAESSSTSQSSTSADIAEITTAWKQSNYYFLAAGMLIPSAQVLQQYLNIYDNREKFILMLPDIRYIQEEIIGQAVGEDFIEHIASIAIKGTSDKVLSRFISRLRKAFAAHLESRTNVLKTDNNRRVAAHNEAISLTDQAIEYIALNQSSLKGDTLTAFKTSPLYIPPTASDSCECEKKFKNNRKGNAFFATPNLR